MATPEPLQSSRRLSKAAHAERERLSHNLEQLNLRAAGLQKELGEIKLERERVVKRLALLDELAPPDESRHVYPLAEVAAHDPPPQGLLRGSAIRRTAVRLLAATEASTTPIHYTDWLGLVQEAGFGVDARNPAASFLTQINRSVLVRRAEAPGMYTLDLDATDRLRERLQALNAELLGLHHGQQTLEAIVSTRQRRDELIAEIAQSERALEDALDTLQNGPSGAEHSAS